MLIKRFEAETTREALAAVKETFGPEAVILSTRNVRSARGPFGLLGKTVVEVTAAIDREPELEKRSARGGPTESWRALQMSRAVVAPLEEELRALRRSFERAQAERAKQERAERPSLSEEVAELRRATRALLARVPEARVDDPEAQYQAAGLSAALCADIGNDARARIHDGCGREDALVGALAERLEAKLATPRRDGGHRLVIGGPGVGKTTTVAKQAALIGDRYTRLVSADAHRHGGSASLRGLSKALGFKVDVVTHPDALVRIAGKRNARVVVDTPGCARDDRDALHELTELGGALGDDREVQLVVSATTKECDLREELAHYRCLQPGSLIVTKVDDSSDLGNVINLLLEAATPPLAWIGKGQRIPEDLVTPDSEKLARQALAGCL